MADNSVPINMNGVIAALQNSVQAINSINQTLNAIFPIATALIATTASAGTASVIPSTTAGFLTANIGGTAYKIPLYRI